MSNEADRAEEATELFFRAAMSNRKHTSLLPCGRCHYCNDTIKQGALFCNADCAHDHEEEERRKRIAGR